MPLIYKSGISDVKNPITLATIDAYEEIEFVREPSFRDSQHIDDGTSYV